LLIVEDDQKFAKVLLDIGRDKHFKCLLAEDGQTGLQLAFEYQPQAIILDVGLPQLDGWSVMEKLKQDPQTRHIPVHFMSAYDHRKEAKQKGAIGYLLKPINMEQLGAAFKKIERFISNHLKKLLILTDNENRQRDILNLVADAEIQVSMATTRVEAFKQLYATPYDCLILDLDIEQGGGLSFLEQLPKDENLSQIPVIIYAERELTLVEQKTVHDCENNLTLKAVRSPERLLEEVTLFLHQVEGNLSKEKRQMLQMVHNKEVILKDKKVLIVDDDTRNTFALFTVLEEKEMEVIVAQHGKEALDLLTEHPNVDIVLMDIMMPEMDGYEAIQRIRAQPQFRKLPIIALTAKAMKGDKAKCIEAGANDYLSKPVDLDKLFSLMRVWLYR
jgi:CheY-like chemotaxis protein